jgi:hypothetical protein
MTAPSRCRCEEGGKAFYAGRDSRNLTASGETFEGAFVRAVLSALVICGAAAQGYAWPAAADTACAGNACSVLLVAADGCAFQNKGDKAVRFSLVAGGAPRVVTVLRPGETFKEADKNFCVVGDASDKRLEASFAVLGKAPTDDRDFTLKGTKPSVAAPEAVRVATTAPAIALPRAKPAVPPAYPPAPRAKPEVVEVAMAAPPAPPPVGVPAPPAPVAPPAAIQPTTSAEAAAAMPTAACGEACPPILFKVIDNCLWVMNLNPRAVAFEAEIGGKRTALSLEAADGDKADAHAAVAQVKDLGALHMRLKDPFQSAGSGIPVYRARLGSPGSCVKSRAEISTFTAAYVK